MGLLSRMGRAATALSKYYYPFTWKNKPSIESPINEVHLNHIEDGINEMDNRILILAQDKADASDMANVFIDFDIDDTTGTMTFTRFDGTTKSRDTPMEKIILNCYLEDDNFVLVLADGTKQKVSLAKFIDTYTFINSDTIRFTVNNKNISADIPDGKITLAKLEPTIMSTIRQYALDAQTAQGVAEQAAGTAQGWAIGGTGFEDNNAKHYASRSQRYAVGGVEEGDTEDNAKYYCQQAQAAAEQATEVAGFDGTASTVSAIDTQGVAVRKASGTTHVTITAGGPEPDVGLEYFGQPGDKVTVQDMCDSLAAPGFDDSGVVQEISGFSDFLNRMTSGMRLPSFFRDLKAGLKFVLHTGQLVNNGLCNEPGKYPLDAAYGRTLLEMIGNTEILPGGAADIVSAIVAQNTNLKEYYSLKDAITIPKGADLNSYTEFGNFVCYSAETAATLINCPASKGGFVLHVERSTGATNGDFFKQKIIYNTKSCTEFWRTNVGEAGWGPWVFPLTNADIQSGAISITPTGINKPTYKQITFPIPYSAAPAIVVSPITSAPNLVSASVLDVTSTGCKIYLTRSDAIQATSVMWIAIRK